MQGHQRALRVQAAAVGTCIWASKSNPMGLRMGKGMSGRRGRRGMWCRRRRQAPHDVGECCTSTPHAARRRTARARIARARTAGAPYEHVRHCSYRRRRRFSGHESRHVCRGSHAMGYHGHAFPIVLAVRPQKDAFRHRFTAALLLQSEPLVSQMGCFRLNVVRKA